MYFIDFIKSIIKRSNIGVLIYLILNTLIVVTIFSDGFKNTQGILYGLAVYIISLMIALSPTGEWILRFQTGCKKIKRKEYSDRLEPLFNEVLNKARAINPSIPEDVKLFMNDDKDPNAFATGRKTICLTKGFLNYSDEQIKATFAHELGHLAHKDTDLILMVTIGNFIVTGIFIFYRILVRILGFFLAIASRNFAPMVINFLIDIVLAVVMWIWTKIGTMLVLYSSRKNEFEADEFAHKCGYGYSLASVLVTFDGSGSRGLWANLISTHPDSDDRISKLQELGCNYIKG